MAEGAPGAAMARETAEAPEVVARLMRDCRPAVAELERLFTSRRPTHLVTSARGSSDHAAHYLKYLCEILLGLPCASVGASVASVYGARLDLEGCIVTAVSQSGASPDSLAFAAEVKRAGAPLITITNAADSPLGRLADVPLVLGAGPEESVAATKTFIASVALAARIIAAWAGSAEVVDACERLPEALARAASIAWPPLEDRLVGLGENASLYVLGRGPALAMAEEAALKLKETSGLHAEAYSTAEVVHGPMELIRPDFPVVLMAPPDAAAGTNRATAARLRAAGAEVYIAGHEPGDLPTAATAHPLLDPIAMIQSFYGCACRIAIRRGRDPDRPHLLSKVTRTL